VGADFRATTANAVSQAGDVEGSARSAYGYRMTNEMAAALRKLDAVLDRGVNTGARLLSLRATARLLGLSRTSTLGELIARKAIRTVKVGERVRVPRSEIERIEREGLTIPPRRARGRRRATPGICDPEAIRRLNLDEL
jgi:excisionase family DNA binding protein